MEPLVGKAMSSPWDFRQNCAILSPTGILPWALVLGEGPPLRSCLLSENIAPVHACVLKAGFECFLWISNCAGDRGQGGAGEQ